MKDRRRREHGADYCFIPWAIAWIKVTSAIFFFKSTANILVLWVRKQSSETTKPRSDTESASVTSRPQGQTEILAYTVNPHFSPDSHLCKFTYLPKLICNCRISKVLLWQTCTESQKTWAIDAHVPWGWTKLVLPSYFSSYTVDRCLFQSIFKPCFSQFCAFCRWFHCLKCSPKCSDEVLSSGPNHEKLVMCFMEKIHVSENFLQAWVVVLLTWVQC